MSVLRACILPFFTPLLLTACIAKDIGSLGDLEPCDESTSTTAGDSGMEPTAGDEGGTCPDPAQTYYEPVTEGCEDAPSPPVLAEAGCYETCNNSGGGPCALGTCTQVQVQQFDCGGLECCVAFFDLCLGDAPDLVCGALVGTTFLSTEELECGLGPDGPVLCHWQIAFEVDGDYLWQYSDIGQGGTYTCEGAVLTLDDPAIGTSYDPATGILTWDGVEYVAEPA